MNKKMIIIGISIFVITVIIYIVKNYKSFSNLKNNRLFNFGKNIFYFIIILCCIICIKERITNIISNIYYFKDVEKNDKMFNESDNKILKEDEFYNEQINKKYENQNSKNPYIPEGFSYLNGEWNTGFVIQDEDGNEYVWVPCTNIEDSEIPKLERKNFTELADEVFISKDSCYNESYEQFIKSSLENGGFYISRYEIGKENDIPVSKSGIPIYGNISKNEALRLVDEMYKNKDINCELINAYAYDTTLSWILSNNDITFYKTDIRNFDEICSGRNQYNNIFDFTDNILEYSLENCYDTSVIRGFAYNDEIEGRTRYTIISDEDFFDYMSLISFRTIIYK